MIRLKAILALSVVLVSAAASAPAFAWHHGSVRFGVFVGAPFDPWYYPRGWQRVAPRPSPGG
jgi:hypothetical protein